MTPRWIMTAAVAGALGFAGAAYADGNPAPDSPQSAWGRAKGADAQPGAAGAGPMHNTDTPRDPATSSGSTGTVDRNAGAGDQPAPGTAAPVRRRPGTPTPNTGTGR